jgi:hypothetical protein
MGYGWDSIDDSTEKFCGDVWTNVRSDRGTEL